jgi:hypothetical protein
MQHKFIFLLLFLSFAYTGIVSAQEGTYTIDKETPFEVYVSGSSTLHDWKATVSTVTDYPESLKIGKDGIENFTFKAAVSSMDGGRGSTMNNKIYKALKSETHPQITFEQQSPASIKALPGGQFKLTSTGLLSIGGKEKTVDVEVMGTKKDGKLVLQGSKPLKLSEFEIDPPSAMFGQIQTHDDVTVHFIFNYLVQ